MTRVSAGYASLMKTCLLLLFGTLAWAGTAEAQARGQVHGTVVDETHGAIVRAAVTLIGIPAGTPKQTHTDGAGRFAVNDVVAGDYVLRVVAAGFQDADLTLTVGREAPPPVTITMQVGGLEEQVTVVGSRAGPPTRADQNADAVGLDRDFLGQLPLDGNDVMALVSTLLAPSAGGIDGPSVIIDGVEGSALDLSASAIRHITVNRNPYSAEFRRPGKDRYLDCYLTEFLPGLHLQTELFCAIQERPRALSYFEHGPWKAADFKSRLPDEDKCELEGVPE